MAAVEKHQVAKLNLDANQLGPEGGAKLAEALKTNTSLKVLQCAMAAPRTDAQRSLLWPRPRVTRPPLCARRLQSNGLDGSAEQAVRAAWGDRGGYRSLSV